MFFYFLDEWNSLFGDVTKFGLGLFSILFDLLFIVQHYILYRPRNRTGYENIPESSSATINQSRGSNEPSRADNLSRMYGDYSGQSPPPAYNPDHNAPYARIT